MLLSICMGLAICNLLASLRTDNAQDYVYLSFFLICKQCFPLYEDARLSLTLKAHLFHFHVSFRSIGMYTQQYLVLHHSGWCGAFSCNKHIQQMAVLGEHACNTKQ